MNKKKFLFSILICILVIIIFSFYEYIMSPARVVKPYLSNIINTKQSEYIKSISAGNQIYNSKDTYNFLISLKGKKLTFANESSNEGAKNLYLYGIQLNDQTIGVGIINEGNFLIPKWKIEKVYLW